MSKTWFITGAGRGIGTEVAKAALAAGHNVVATGRHRKQVQQAFEGTKGQLLIIELDVTSPERADFAVDAAVTHFGGIDVLVNNAGYGQIGLFEENGADDIERQFATNVFGMFHVTRAVLPVMRWQRAGRIFNFSSMGGMVGFAGASIYCSTKFAVEGFSESLAMEIAQFGIHVTIVEPGFFQTDFLDESSVRYGEQGIKDYASFSSETRTTYDGYSYKQAGNPAKLGSALVELAASREPPLRYVAGSDAVKGIATKLDSVHAEINKWRSLSISTDGSF
ncbi:oxidoreductase [Phyllobacterium myrsinacearum]|uniref:NAD(P)-dependent dehydrogenase (Short-subunit alcohol dehydrogenase family) n=1 Tax=Phyllobacterium myrsinacearum TaxID=28101 RepID=A0A839ESR3_9HYPH|nr:oxidoreductase [Phyllobacterium myrsinacearum]MBA8881959.1 NAD(P)-dependent dehydrogenase (short-subunit alcohol dehydrogenase family) [Phyllobacterium myrsinacearum]